MQIYIKLTLFEIARVKNCDSATVRRTIAIFDSKPKLYVSAKIESSEF